MVFLFIFIIFIFFNVMLVFSKIIIEIENLRFTSHNSKHLNDNYKIIIKLKAFGIITYSQQHPFDIFPLFVPKIIR